MNLFQPLGARCLVKPTEKPPISTIIVAPDASKGKSDEGIIIAMGTEPFGHGKPVSNQNTGQLVQVKVGDSVLFQQYTGSHFTIGGTEYRVLAYDDLLGIIHKLPDPPEPQTNGGVMGQNRILTPKSPERKLIVSPEEAADGL
jgi:chaperonin GroES